MLIKLGENSVQLACERLAFEFPIDVLWASSLLVKAGVVCHKSNVNSLITSQNSKMDALFGLYFVTLHSDL